MNKFSGGIVFCLLTDSLAMEQRLLEDSLRSYKLDGIIRALQHGAKTNSRASDGRSLLDFALAPNERQDRGLKLLHSITGPWILPIGPAPIRPPDRPDLNALFRTPRCYAQYELLKAIKENGLDPRNLAQATCKAAGISDESTRSILAAAQKVDEARAEARLADIKYEHGNLTKYVLDRAIGHSGARKR